MIKTFLVSLALLSSTCESAPPRPPLFAVAGAPSAGAAGASSDSAGSSSDAGSEDVDAAAHSPCYLACKQLTKLSCPEAKSTPKGATCAQVCTNVESSSVISFNPSCVANATSCAKAAACH